MSQTCLEMLGINKLKEGDTYYSVMTGNTMSLGHGAAFSANSPIDGAVLSSFLNATPEQLDEVSAELKAAFKALRTIPAPRRGELVRRIGEEARKYKHELAQVISLEAGKIMAEALGEVQEWIDVCDFAVGQSRMLHGLSIVSERPGHRMMEQWQPLGPVAVITAFNFPMAVWSWNAMLGLICGDPILLKPSEKAPLCALAMYQIAQNVLADMPDIPKASVSVMIGDRDLGEAIAASETFPLVSATGSTAMGRAVAQTVAARLGRSLLELGGNNAMIVSDTADLDLALRAIVFSAAGTAGQRCTTLRRLICHDDIVDSLVSRLEKSYSSLPIGNPLTEGTLVGPLIDAGSYQRMQAALESAKQQGGEMVCGGERVTEGVPQGGYYVKPAIVRIAHDAPIVHEETFAPILYVLTYTDFAEAVEIQNEVPQGLSSAVFTESMREAEFFMSPAGSDCGIANVNIGTSGAEIGGAFGGEKDTGGGRESGSDAWRNYMRRTTNTVNYGGDLPLAQGIVFE
ncbi:L-piperidine-6-carboxylate dehydrogenase [Marinomonas posidonica]|uniref:aldehyde dehydrogenase (NAD(+)) n=1 Tax=Marinomonas posidonica (strain CECT 7376 / NCIMB 14433 / IVIA-Po-181) TaxID=491952 RepID=F6D1C2_MARPP|nr:aldehyde dehydrogenase family protein [Marinomonas posidonica]AEF56011.1 L-aminoadipate-semialdehyde dehydrogenase [Marinomonas posidonica IVIA-Po-181]